MLRQLFKDSMHIVLRRFTDDGYIPFTDVGRSCPQYLLDARFVHHFAGFAEKGFFGCQHTLMRPVFFRKAPVNLCLSFMNVHQVHGSVSNVRYQSHAGKFLYAICHRCGPLREYQAPGKIHMIRTSIEGEICALILQQVLFKGCFLCGYPCQRQAHSQKYFCALQATSFQFHGQRRQCQQIGILIFHLAGGKGLVTRANRVILPLIMEQVIFEGWCFLAMMHHSGGKAVVCGFGIAVAVVYADDGQILHTVLL